RSIFVCLFLLIRRQPISTLFPYTTLFRSRNIERNVPPVVQPGGKREPNLADDLRPPVERGVSVLPGCKRERRPALRPVAHGGARGFVHVEHDDALRQATAGNGAAS